MKTGYWHCCGLFIGFMFIAGCLPQHSVASDPKPAPVVSTENVVAPAVFQVPERSVRPQSRPVESSAEEPTIVFEKSVHDFGSVGPGSLNSVDFAFTNTGNAVLKIEDFHTTCGCTVPELDKREYAPGESGKISVRYSAPASTVTDEKQIYVYTNDPKTPQYELTIKAKVEVNVTVSPVDVSLMLDQDNAGMPPVTIKSTDGREFAVTSIKPTNNVMTIPFDSNKRGTEITLQPKVDLEKLNMTPTGIIEIRTNHPNSGILYVRYVAKPFFEVSHPRLILQNVSPGEEVIRDIWIRSNYDKKVSIESFSSTNKMMTIIGQEEDGNHLKIQVKITVPTNAPAAGSRNIADELIINLTNGQRISIRCTGWFQIH